METYQPQDVATLSFSVESVAAYGETSQLGGCDPEASACVASAIRTSYSAPTMTTEQDLAVLAWDRTLPLVHMSTLTIPECPADTILREACPDGSRGKERLSMPRSVVSLSEVTAQRRKSRHSWARGGKRVQEWRRRKAECDARTTGALALKGSDFYNTIASVLLDGQARTAPNSLSNSDLVAGMSACAEATVSLGLQDSGSSTSASLRASVTQGPVSPAPRVEATHILESTAVPLTSARRWMDVSPSRIEQDCVFAIVGDDILRVPSTASALYEKISCEPATVAPESITHAPRNCLDFSLVKDRIMRSKSRHLRTRRGWLVQKRLHARPVKDVGHGASVRLHGWYASPPSMLILTRFDYGTSPTPLDYHLSNPIVVSSEPLVLSDHICSEAELPSQQPEAITYTSSSGAVPPPGTAPLELLAHTKSEVYAAPLPVGSPALQYLDAKWTAKSSAVKLEFSLLRACGTELMPVLSTRADVFAARKMDVYADSKASRAHTACRTVRTSREKSDLSELRGEAVEARRAYLESLDRLLRSIAEADAVLGAFLS